MVSDNSQRLGRMAVEARKSLQTFLSNRRRQDRAAWDTIADSICLAHQDAEALQHDLRRSVRPPLQAMYSPQLPRYVESTQTGSTDHLCSIGSSVQTALLELLDTCDDLLDNLSRKFGAVKDRWRNASKPREVSSDIESIGEQIQAMREEADAVREHVKDLLAWPDIFATRDSQGLTTQAALMNLSDRCEQLHQTVLEKYRAVEERNCRVSRRRAVSSAMKPISKLVQEAEAEAAIVNEQFQHVLETRGGTSCSKTEEQCAVLSLRSMSRRASSGMEVNNEESIRIRKGEKRKRDSWTKFENVEYPNMFGHVELAADGGFSEVGTLYDISIVSRWCNAVLLLVFVMYNVEYIITLDVSYVCDPYTVDGYSKEQMSHINQCFFLTRTLCDAGIKLINAVQGEEILKVGSVEPVRLLGTLELVGFSFFVVQGVIYLLRLGCTQGQKRWYAVVEIFWSTIPMMSVYSAMKLLDKLAPTKLITTVTTRLQTVLERRKKGAPVWRIWSPMLSLVLECVFCFIVGLDMFLLRLRVVNASINHSELTMDNICPSILFLVQVLGIVQLGTFVRLRLFNFIFAGEDGVLEEHEAELMYTWNALLARRLYREHTFVQFLVLMMSFSDEDFQKLVLNDSNERSPSRAETFSNWRGDEEEVPNGYSRVTQWRLASGSNNTKTACINSSL